MKAHGEFHDRFQAFLSAPAYLDEQFGLDELRS
jgi:hypothetical protein